MNELTTVGLFGPIRRFISTSEMIEQGYAADMDIKCIQFEYSDETVKYIHSKIKEENGKKKALNAKYVREINFINSHEKRLKFLGKLILKMPGNTMVLFDKIESYGEVLYNICNDNKTDEHEVFYIVGGVKTDKREEIRVLMNNRDKKRILFASAGTSSTGVSINNIDNLIIASPSKARIRVLQSIGRGLRQSETKSKVIVYDISDDMRKGKKTNYTYTHFIERLKMFISEKFNYKIVKVKIE